MTPPRVLVGILNYNSADDSVQTAQSLRAMDYPAFDLLVLDNGSTNDAADRIAAECPWLAVERNEENLGFAGGMNSLLDRAAARGYSYALLCNNDIAVAPEALAYLVETAEANPRAAVVGGVSASFASGEELVIGGERFDLIRGRTIWSRSRPAHGHLKPVAFVQGALMLFRVKAYAAGLHMDERLFMYLEEPDLSFRLRALAFEALIDTRVLVRHKGEDRFLVPRNAYLQQRNRMYLVRTHGSWTQYVLHVGYVAIFELPVKVIVRTVQGHGQFAWACVCGFTDGIRGRMNIGAFWEFGGP
jgi:GT2 family glycosyltransferase